MSETIQNHMERYLEWQRASGYSRTTLRGNTQNLTAFARYLSKTGTVRTADVTAATIQGYITHVRSRRTSQGNLLSPSSVDSLLATVRTFLKWAAKERLIYFDLFDEFPSVKTRRAPKRTLSALEVERILSLPDTDTAKGIRDRTILEILYSTGIRRAEVSNLRLEDMNEHNGTLFIREGKGKKDRIIPAGDRVLQWVRRYLAQSRSELTSYGRRAKKSKDEGWLFPSRVGTKLTPEKVSDITGGYLRKAGIKNGACHLFRHTMATLMLENGADVRYIQEMLGHAGIETTQIYTRVSAKHLKETMHRAHPVSWEEEPGYSASTSHAGTIESRRFVTLHMRKPKRIPEVDVSKSELHRELAGFREWVIASYARSTAQIHIIYCRFFVEWAVERGVTMVSRVTPELLTEYQKDISTLTLHNGEPMTHHVMRQRMRTVRQFFRWLWKSGTTLVDPSASLVLPRTPRHLPADVLTTQEAEAILAAPDISTPYGIRDRAVIELFYATGMRKSELSGIKLDDVNHEAHTIRITDAKTKEYRVIPAGSRAFKWIGLYLECSREMIAPGQADSGYLFICGHGEGLGDRMGEIICRKHIKAAGLQKKRATHIFRHTVATLMLENGADIRAVQEFLGHRSIKSTEFYTHVSVKKLREVHAKTHPGERRYLERLRSVGEDGEEETGGSEIPQPEVSGVPTLAPQASLRGGSDHPEQDHLSGEVSA